ncbi:hypothetical protein N7449_012538 [Penicillium cf. viridicatum]|uniref:Uncharacterized protein n=1 Tax=Penicillium cf. viridicatum TaxID=2972119 RepID=A0A9W9INE2_9EURO|nr:hypothetical protein N7449_012538 [Penicillium cf. viridicatum]
MPRCAPGAPAVVTGLRGLLAPGTIKRSVDRWPLAIPETQIPGETARTGSFAGVVTGSGPIRGPHAAACQRLHAPGRINCVRTGAEEFSGGNWMVSASRYAGGAAATGLLARFHLTSFYPLGGLGSRDSPPPPGGGPPGTSCHEVTWLILPVVICLSQRLSHACLKYKQLVL